MVMDAQRVESCVENGIEDCLRNLQSTRLQGH